MFEGVRISRDDTVLPDDGSGRDAIRADRFVAGNPSLRQTVRGGAEPSRQKLIQQLDAALRALESQLEAIHASGAQQAGGDMEAQGGARLKQLNALRDQLVSGANGVPPAALRAEVTSAVASTLAYTSDIRAASTGPAANRAAAEAALHQASEEAHRTVTDFMHDFYDRRIFDPYLKFASEKDKEDYSRNREERKEQMEKALAEHTPEGDLRANRLAIEQMKDAGIHGADRSSEYQSTLDNLKAKSSRLSRELNRQPASDMQAPAKTDPLDAVKAAAESSPDLIASLRTTGIAVADQNGDGHGVTAASSGHAAGRGGSAR